MGQRPMLSLSRAAYPNLGTGATSAPAFTVPTAFDLAERFRASTNQLELVAWRGAQLPKMVSRAMKNSDA